MEFDFVKMHGTGNDFIVVDNRTRFFPASDQSFIHHLCQSHTGIGADGLLLLEHSSKADFRMRYFNSDGNESEMCVNGSRCICHFSFFLKVIDQKHSFEAGDGLHSGYILDNHHVRVQVNVHKKGDLRTFPVDFELPNSISFVDFVNTGVPHLVLQCEQIEQIPVEDLGRKLRFHPYYAPQGANVNFVHFDRSEAALVVRTYERGVEAETLSCGSGVTASVLAISNKYKNPQHAYPVITRGGRLIVQKEKEMIFLEGPVKFIFKGKYIEEDIS